MWGAIVGWLKSLFGGRGGTQIGQGNQTFTASTAGDNSPAVMAGRDVHFNMPSAPASVDEDAETFAELEETLGDLLSDLRKQLAENPLLRDLIVLDRKSISYFWTGPHIMCSEDESPGVRSKVEVLVNHGLATETKPDFAYRMSERLVRYLRKK
jgi:hypothetical protein